MEIIFQIIFEFVIVVPGAFVRWLWFKGKRPFKELLIDRNASNYIISFIILGVIVMIGINVSR